MLMAHWELPFTVESPRPMTGCFKDPKACSPCLIWDNSDYISSWIPLQIICNHMVWQYLVYPIPPFSPPHRYNSWEHLPVNSVCSSPSLHLFPGNSNLGTLRLYRVTAAPHLVHLAFSNKPQQVNMDPRESDVRHEVKCCKEATGKDFPKETPDWENLELQVTGWQSLHDMRWRTRGRLKGVHHVLLSRDYIKLKG